MDYKNIFKKACLIQLNSSVWQCSRAINQSVLSEKVEGNTEWLRGRKYLISPLLLGPIKTAVHQSRNHINKFALPFPVTSLYLIPKDTLTIIDERLKFYKERFWNKVDDFCAIYDAAREEAKQVLGDLFSETDYPEDIRTKFKYEYRYLVLGIPGKTSLLSPEIYEREKEKFQSLMEETRNIAMCALRTEFGQLVTHLTDRLNGNNGKPVALRSSMFNNLTQFLQGFKARNLFNDDKLVELSDQALSIIGGVSSYGLQYNDLMRKKIQKDMNTLKDAIDEAIEEIPRRKIRLSA